MRVLVTGSSGRVGRAVVNDLLAREFDVVRADRVRSADDRHGRKVRFIETDLSDVGQVAGAMEGCDAVVHLGAIPNPYDHPDEVVFINNVGATFATLQAARLLGVKKAVIASSLSALGTAYAPVPFAPPYAPVDEDSPMLNHDVYGLSKEVDERTAEMFHRRTGMQVIALRFHWVASHAEARAAAEALKADPAKDNSWRLFWGYVDLRDAATICRLSVEVDGLGFEPFVVTAADSLADQPTEALIRSMRPEVELRRPISGIASAFALDKAKRLLGFEPKHSWRDAN